MIKNLFLIGIGGGLGSILRWLTGIYTAKWNGSFPIGTFAVNIFGSLLIGIAYGYLQKNGSNEILKLLFITGFCGGFTTFSAFSYENMQLIQNGQWTTFALYASMSFLFCIAAVFAGYLLFSN